MPFTLTRSRLIILGSAALVVVFLALLFMGVIPGLRVRPPSAPPVELVVWGVFDSNQAIDALETSYRDRSSNVQVSYRQFDPSTYETELINALAAGTGPDVFMFQNTWLPKHINKITPVSETQLPYAEFRDAFPQVISEEFAPNKIIYASPLYLDTLAMFYNKDTFDKKGIAVPPKTWTEFTSAVQKLKEVNTQTSDIIKAGASIGGSNQSINRGTDLLTLIMLQSGAQMVNSGFSGATFAEGVSNSEQPGLDSLNFYTSFANPSSPTYTWNENLHYSIDNFAEGNAAIIFNYSHQIDLLKKKNPFLNFGVAPAPQIENTPKPVAYANYWGLAVSNKSKNPAWAWDFIKFATMNKETAKKYFDTTRRPPALKSLIQDNLNEPDFGVFARQSLIARSWPQIDNNAVDNSFSNMIKAVITGQLSALDSIRKAQDEITQLMQKRQ